MVYTATDDISGVAHTTGYVSGLVFTSPSGAQNVKINASVFVLTSGTSLDGSHSATATFPQYAESGVWQLTGMLVEDKVGNLLNLGSSELASLEISASVEITSVSDTTAPVVTGVSVSPQVLGHLPKRTDDRGGLHRHGRYIRRGAHDRVREWSRIYQPFRRSECQNKRQCFRPDLRDIV